MDQLVNLVADRMPGKTHKKRRDHLRVILANLVKLTGAEKTHEHYSGLLPEAQAIL